MGRVRRFRNRYLAIKLIPSSSRNLADNLAIRLKSIVGSGVLLIDYDQSSGIAILRCNHLVLDRLRRLFPFRTFAHGELPAAHLVGISGTIRKLRKKLQLAAAGEVNPSIA